VGARTVLVWRHGQTAWNSQRRFQGQLDIELDDLGRAQAARAAALLAGFAPSAIVSSDLVRARETAQALADVTGLPIATDPRLREIDVGVWQGLTFDEVSERFPVEAAMWRDGGDGRRGGGESLVEVGARAVAAVDDALLKLANGQTVVVVTHGAAGRAIVASMIGLPTPFWRSLGSLANCCWSLMGESASGWRLFDHNAGSLPEVVIGDDR
jgi:glucosyl-3-phosphoglycerate phosphatase